MTLEELIARFDREHPAEMEAAREALKANPLTHHDIISADITDIMLMHEVNRLRAELAEVDARLDAAIYESSKDWWYSDRLGRIDWLHAMHVGKSQESDMWVAQIITLRDELIEARKPDCHRCRRYHRYGFGEGVCANTLIGEPACINGDGFREADPVRLYEKEEE